MSATKPPLGLMPEWRHKELRLQEIREAIERYLGAKEAIPVNWIAEEYALRTWLENREESKKELTPDTPAPEQTTKEGLWSDEDMVEFANQYHWSSTRITLDKFKASKQSLSNTPREKSYYENLETIGKLNSTPKEEQPTKERIWVMHIRKNEKAFVHFGGNTSYTMETWGEIPEEKFPLIKEAIENIINHKNK